VVGVVRRVGGNGLYRLYLLLVFVEGFSAGFFVCNGLFGVVFLVFLVWCGMDIYLVLLRGAA